MVIVMEPHASDQQIEVVINNLNAYGFDVHRSSGVNQTVLGAIGVKPGFDVRIIGVLDGVAHVQRITEPYKFASRMWKDEPTLVEVGGVEVGGKGIVLMAGPGVVESGPQIEETAAMVAAQGATFLRGGAFRPQTSPYSFQGLGEEGLKLLRQAADRHNLRVVTEVTDITRLAILDDYTDVFQVGARNMQNFGLLQRLGHADKPVLLKRGVSATITEWLMAAEYVMSHGNPNVILCERGIRTFETYTRNTLDLSAVPIIKKKSHLPIIVDPSRATGIRNKVTPMARAAVAAGADGVMVEVHPDPESARSDGPQSLFFSQYQELVQQIRDIAQAIGRYLHECPLATQA
ncbi:MAG: 3-deoxy-7-phosphoheptulonate synthase [Bacteroidota bacterium]|nr:3-deoxy-7-phosphoheptulonate synthase [Bacteroidota bacterium]